MNKIQNYVSDYRLSLRLAKAARQGKTIRTHEDGSYEIIINR